MWRTTKTQKLYSKSCDSNSEKNEEDTTNITRVTHTEKRDYLLSCEYSKIKLVKFYFISLLSVCTRSFFPHSTTKRKKSSSIGAAFNEH